MGNVVGLNPNNIRPADQVRAGTDITPDKVDAWEQGADCLQPVIAAAENHRALPGLIGKLNPL